MFRHRCQESGKIRANLCENVGLSVSVQVSDQKRARGHGDTCGDCGLESTVTVTQQNRQLVQRSCEQEVLLTVTVEIGDRAEAHCSASGWVPRSARCEGAVSLAEQDGAVAKHKVGLAVAIHVGGELLPVAREGWRNDKRIRALAKRGAGIHKREEAQNNGELND